MPGPIVINYTNLSATAFNQSGSFTGYGVEKGVGSLSTMPTDTLSAMGGMTSMEMDENALSNLMGGYAWINLGWKDPNTDTHFGLKIYMPVQILHIGSQPYYETAYIIDNSGDPDWSKPVSNPADPYSFPTSIGYNVACTPKASHTSLSVQVQITDL